MFCQLLFLMKKASHAHMYKVLMKVILQVENLARDYVKVLSLRAGILARYVNMFECLLCLQFTLFSADDNNCEGEENCLY